MGDKQIDPEKLIKLLGGNSNVAKLWEVTPGAVSQWIPNGVPADFIKFLRVARPDVIKKLGV
jgi:hypothetical protein